MNECELKKNTSENLTNRWIVAISALTHHFHKLLGECSSGSGVLWHNVYSVFAIHTIISPFDCHSAWRFLINFNILKTVSVARSLGLCNQPSSYFWYLIFCCLCKGSIYRGCFIGGTRSSSWNGLSFNVSISITNINHCNLRNKPTDRYFTEALKKLNEWEQFVYKK